MFTLFQPLLEALQVLTHLVLTTTSWGLGPIIIIAILQVRKLMQGENNETSQSHRAGM